MNIKQFAEPTFFRAKRVEVGTISRFIGERCLDSGGNYVLAYDTTVTAIEISFEVQFGHKRVKNLRNIKLRSIIRLP